jgi:hypothetical protein
MEIFFPNELTGVNSTNPVTPVILALLVIAVELVNVAIPITGVKGKIGVVFTAIISIY